MIQIKDLKEGQSVQFSALLTQVSKGVTNAGQPYLTLSLQDKTGTIEAK